MKFYELAERVISALKLNRALKEKGLEFIDDLKFSYGGVVFKFCYKPLHYEKSLEVPPSGEIISICYYNKDYKKGVRDSFLLPTSGLEMFFEGGDQSDVVTLSYRRGLAKIKISDIVAVGDTDSFFSLFVDRIVGVCQELKDKFENSLPKT